MFTITVGPRKEGIQTADGANLVVISATIRRSGRDVSLNTLKELGEIRDVAITVRSKKELHALQLKDRVRRGILYFLSRYHGKGDRGFDCYSFASLVQGIPAHDKLHLFSYWDVETDKQLDAGDTIFFLGPGDYFYHAAVYLGQGVFVSVYGAGGDLEFSTLEDMHKGFRGTPVVALPRAATN